MSDDNKDAGNDSAFQRLLDRYKNDGIALAEKLFTENYQYRDKQRQLEQQITDLSGKVPTAETVVLSAADAQAWTAYQALGKPEQIKQGLDERTKLQGDMATKEREAILRNVAEAAGFKPSVLTNLDRIAKAEGKELAFSVRDVQVDGRTVKVGYVKDGDSEVQVTDYAQTAWSDFMPALVVQGTPPPAQGTRYVTQHAGSGSQGNQDLVGKFLSDQQAAQAAVKNPLLKGQ